MWAGSKTCSDVVPAVLVSTLASVTVSKCSLTYEVCAQPLAPTPAQAVHLQKSQPELKPGGFFPELPRASPSFPELPRGVWGLEDRKRLRVGDTATSCR